VDQAPATFAVDARAKRPGLGRRLLDFWQQHGFIRLIVRRTLALIVLSFGITVVAFVLTHLVPGDPLTANLSFAALANPRIVAAYKAEYGLDKPLTVQYELYLSHLVHGNLGISQYTHRPVATDLRQFFPASVELGILALAIALAVAVPLGLMAAVRADSAIDQLLSLVSQVGISTPPFWVGLIALYMFSFVFQLAPSSGRLSPGAIPPSQVTGLYTIDSLLTGDLSTFGDAVHHLILPAMVLAIGYGGILLRFTRSAVLEVIHNDFVIAARAKGLPGRSILVRYTLRAALVPIITLFGLMFADLMAGTVLVESVFAYPGIGLYAAHTAFALDLTGITGVCLLVAVIYVLTNFVIDILHSVIDPRVLLE
jgi:peptide/nickel transport system permease protein